MELLIWLVVGAAIGWLGHVVTLPDGHGSLLLNVLVGLGGAILGGLLLSPIVGIDVAHDSIEGLGSAIVSLAGAVMLLSVVHIVWRSRAR